MAKELIDNQMSYNELSFPVFLLESSQAGNGGGGAMEASAAL